MEINKIAKDVTRSNFLTLLKEIEDVIKNCDFISFDTELSGVRATNSYNLFDTHEERYQKNKQIVEGFQIIQYGITCWKKSNNEQYHYDAHCYNFWIFPQKSPVPKCQNDRNFTVQASSLSFLIENGFDFNKLIKEGISFLNSEEEQKCREALKTQEETSKNQEPRLFPTVDESDKEYLIGVLERIKSFVHDSDQEKLDLEPSSGFRRKIVYETIKTQTFFNSIQLTTCSTPHNVTQKYISINKITPEQKEKKQNEILTEAVGFSNIIKMIVDCKKPLVGHNLFLDIMHTFNQFIATLPQSYEEFKDSIRTLFSTFYDTKFIANNEIFKDYVESSALGDLFERVKKSPFVEINVNIIDGKFVEGNMHEAGVDSYLTGLCFIKLAIYLQNQIQPNNVCFNPETMINYANKLYICYSYDLKYINIGGDDVKPKRNCLYYVYQFPTTWKYSDLFQLFSPYGGCIVGWIDDNSALCHLKDERNMARVNNELVKGTISNGNTRNYKVITYYDYINNKMQKTIQNSPTPVCKEQPQAKGIKPDTSSEIYKKTTPQEFQNTKKTNNKRQRQDQNMNTTLKIPKLQEKKTSSDNETKVSPNNTKDIGEQAKTVGQTKVFEESKWSDDE